MNQRCGNYFNEIEKIKNLYMDLINNKKKDLFIMEDRLYFVPSDRYLIALPIKNRKKDEKGILIDEKDAKEIISSGFGYYSEKDKRKLMKFRRIYPFKEQIKCEFPITSKDLEKILKGKAIKIFSSNNSGPEFYPYKGD